MSTSEEAPNVTDLRIFAAVVLRGRAIAIEELITYLKREGPPSGVRVLYVKASGDPLKVIDAPPKETGEGVD